ncbi:BON domain protein [compost metagenome]
MDVSEGVVSLTGTVRDRGQKFYIEDLADGTYGVKEVNNDIRVRRELPEARTTGDVTGSTWRG